MGFQIYSPEELRDLARSLAGFCSQTRDSLSRVIDQKQEVIQGQTDFAHRFVEDFGRPASDIYRAVEALQGLVKELEWAADKLEEANR